MTKLRFWDRIWSAFMGIICIVLAAALVLYAGGWLPVEQIKGVLSALALNCWQRWVLIGICALILVLVGIRGISMLFRRRKDKGFVIQHTEFGDLSISMKAMENMVKRCVEAHSELTVTQTKIYLVRNGVSVELKITLASGINIPLTVNALQKQIKQYITSCSGVDVHEVRVKVETDAIKLLPPPEAPSVEPTPVEEMKHVEMPTEPVIQHKEEPAHYVQTSVESASPEKNVSEVPVVEMPEEQTAIASDAEPQTPTAQEEESGDESADEKALEVAASEEETVNA